MHYERKLLSIVLVLSVLLSLMFPCVRTTVMAKTEQTLTVDDQSLYDRLISSFNDGINYGALRSKDGTTRTITVDLEKVKYLYIKKVDMTKDNNSQEIIRTLVCNSSSLQSLYVEDCNLTGFDFSILDCKTSLQYLWLVKDKMNKMPAITMPNVESLGLSKNDFSADDACDNITKAHFPALTRLVLDDCEISDVSFLKNINGLTSLSLGDDRLTDDSIKQLISMSGSCLSGLTTLNLGKKVYLGMGGQTINNSFCTNKFSDLASLASFIKQLPKLESLELHRLEINSLKDFVGVRDSVHIDFSNNCITDFAGLESNKNLTLREQEVTVGDKLTQGKEHEIPELVNRILDKDDVLHGTMSFNNCNLSENGTKLFIHPNVERASVEVEGGRLGESTIHFNLKNIPLYIVPKNLTAKVGDTLASVILPEGFTWEDPSLDVGAAGNHVFKAVYTPKNTDRYIIVDNIEISVTVMGNGTEPTDTPEPSSIPEASGTPEPSETLQPTDTPEPFGTPQTSNIPKPVEPPKSSNTPKPLVPTLVPELPTPTPIVTSLPLLAPTVRPDESHQSGNQIEKRKDLSLQLAVGKQLGRRGIKLTWRKITNCSGYEVYWSYCDGKQNFKKLKTVKNNEKRVCVHRNLKKDRAYKYYIATYRIENGRKYYLSKSPSIHVAMKQEKHTNAKRIKMKKAKVTLQANQSFQMKAVVKKENKHKKLLNHEKNVIRYYTDDTTVATVTKKGRVKARKQGICTVYAIADNGVAGIARITVK